MTRSFRRLLLAALTAAAGTACSSSGTSPDVCPVGTICSPTAQPTIVSLSLSGGRLVSSSVTFWAKKGEDRAGSIFFRRTDGSIDRLVRLKVPGGSLLTRPNGTPFVQGDSIQITISIPDSSKASFEFQPSGLRFSPNDPAELELEYGDASRGDVNGDGRVDAVDRDIITRLGVWLQENANSAFFKLEASFNDQVLEEIEAKVYGFTRYAIAY